jgi:hypothetical protein
VGWWCEEQHEEEKTDKSKRVEKRKQHNSITACPILAKLNWPMMILVLNPPMALAKPTTMMMRDWKEAERVVEEVAEVTGRKRVGGAKNYKRKKKQTKAKESKKESNATALQLVRFWQN